MIGDLYEPDAATTMRAGDSYLGILTADRTFKCPASPKIGDRLFVGNDAASAAFVLTVDGNGKNICEFGATATRAAGEAFDLEYDGTKWRVIGRFDVGNTGDVTAAANITDHAIVRGDGGAKDVQDTAVLIDDSDNLSGAVNLTNTGETIHTPAGSATDTTNQWDVDGITIVKWATDAVSANADIKGIKAGTEGRVIYVYNDDATYSAVLHHNELFGPVAADKMIFTSGGDLTLAPGEISGPITYVDGRWRSAQ